MQFARNEIKSIALFKDVSFFDLAAHGTIKNQSIGKEEVVLEEDTRHREQEEIGILAA